MVHVLAHVGDLDGKCEQLPVAPLFKLDLNLGLRLFQQAEAYEATDEEVEARPTRTGIGPLAQKVIGLEQVVIADGRCSAGDERMFVEGPCQGERIVRFRVGAVFCGTDGIDLPRPAILQGCQAFRSEEGTFLVALPRHRRENLRQHHGITEGEAALGQDTFQVVEVVGLLEKWLDGGGFVDEGLDREYSGFRRDAHPMAVMVGVVGALSAFYHDSIDINDARQREIASHRLIAKIPTLAAMAFKYSAGQPFVYPQNHLSYAENFLHMCFSVPAEPYKVSPVLARAMNKIFILHADHEQNASTSTVRLASSSGANPFACIAAGIACLWGPAHGGANEAVLRMLMSIGSKDKIPEIVKRAKDKDDTFRLMGFGHRVYKNYDPRAKVMQQTCREVLNELGIKNDPLLETAMELERIALQDDYFIQKKLYPNVDFYSGIILRAMGFPMSMFTVLFAVARTAGWVAHWQEQLNDPERKIGRPRQLYTGATTRTFVPVEQRG